MADFIESVSVDSIRHEPQVSIPVIDEYFPDVFVVAVSALVQTDGQMHTVRFEMTLPFDGGMTFDEIRGMAFRQVAVIASVVRGE